MKLSVTALYEGYRSLIRNPQTRWLVVLGTLAYLVSPLDFSPDLLPIAGQLDDVVLVTLLLTELLQLAWNPGQDPIAPPRSQSQPFGGFPFGANPPQGDPRAPGATASGATAPGQTGKTVDVKAVTVDDHDS